jgi:SPP1 gp7 family putative phage head morphogenesis protein
MGKVSDGLRYIFSSFLNWLPEGANKTTEHDKGNVSKTSPTLFDYDVFRINWEKIATLQEIDVMIKSDPRLKRANHVFASTAIQRGLNVKIIPSESVDEKIAEQAQFIITELLQKTQINSKLTPWARSLTKDGELFLNCIVDPVAKKVLDIKNLPALTMQRNENIQGRFDDLADAFRQIDPVSREILNRFPLFAINHIRYDHETGQLYGNSKYLSCRSIFRKLTMTEEDLVVRRRTRAVPRRLHSVGSKDNPGSWDDVKTYKEENNLNNPKLAAITSDYFGNGLTSITDLNGDAQLDHIKDIEHLQELLMIGTGVPLHLLGFGRNVNRDIVEDQKAQFEQDTQELRDLLEYGDDSAFSGLRSIFDLALTLQGINPDLVQYNFLWSSTSNEDVDKKIDRVIKLRSSQPNPIISREFGLNYIGRDMGIENEPAIIAELEKVVAEEDEERKEQETNRNAVNPENPSTAPAYKSIKDSKESHPLHSKKIQSIEQSLKKDVKAFFLAVFKEMKKQGLEKKIQSIDKLRTIHDSVIEYPAPPLEWEHEHDGCCVIVDKTGDKKTKVNELVEQKILKTFDEARKAVIEEGNYSLHNAILKAYYASGNFAFEQPTGLNVNFKFIHSGVKKDLEQAAGERIRGIEETTRQLLAKQLSQAYEKSESLKEWMARIQSVLDVPEWRAEMIAVTETSFAYNASNLSNYKEAGVTKVQYMAVVDNRTCPTCRGDHEKVFNIDDVPSLPRHPLCRCTTVYDS